MKLAITDVKDAGDLSKERIVMKVVSATDIGRFAIFEAGTQDNTITTGVVDIFWFPNAEVDSGDFVVLYTKSGSEKTKGISGGRNTHFFYWGADKAKWESRDVAPVLVYTSDWQAFMRE